MYVRWLEGSKLYIHCPEWQKKVRFIRKMYLTENIKDGLLKWLSHKITGWAKINKVGEICALDEKTLMILKIINCLWIFV
jgi:hypothetical protein